MNTVNLIGNLTKDPEIKTSKSGVAVCRFCIGVRRSTKGQDGQYQSDFPNCIAFKQTAELICRYLHKGSKVAIGGRLQTRNYDAQDGTKQYVTEVVVDRIDFIDTKPQGEAGNAYTTQSPHNTGENGFVQVDNDELPF